MTGKGSHKRLGEKSVYEHAVTWVLALAMSLLACAGPRTLRSGAPGSIEFTISRSPVTAFQAVLEAAHSLNLSVDLMDRDSGLVQFESAGLSPQQLDEYCVYPFVKKGTIEPFSTFSDWNQQSVLYNQGPVTGSVSISVLVSPAVLYVVETFRTRDAFS